MKFEYITHYSINKFEQHDIVKNKLLDYFDKVINCSNEDYDKDVFHKLDWDQSQSSDREWVQFFLHYFQNHLNTECADRNMSIVKINELWFQQYKQGGEHGWHTHGSNYTGVYYVELPETTPVTELINHNGSIFTPDVQEGDVLIFPSFVSHRAPPNNTSIRKTIISFNVDFNEPVGIFKPLD